MHPATCAECGQSCEVPFKPTSDKPIYCSNCFEKNKGSDYSPSSRRDSGRGGYGDKQMFEAICDKCGKSCEVPFKPSSGKPIFCNDCFSHPRSAGSKNTGSTKEQFEIINSKLDKILMALNPKVEKVAEKKTVKKALGLTKKRVAPKKVTRLVSESKRGKKKAVVSASSRSKKKKK
jgi:CxxC-x17-CxxC domain-containing protein